MGEQGYPRKQGVTGRVGLHMRFMVMNKTCSNMFKQFQKTCYHGGVPSGPEHSDNSIVFRKLLKVHRTTDAGL